MPLTKFNRLKSLSHGAFQYCSSAAIVCSAAVLLSACGVGNGTDGDDPVVVENPVAFIKRPLLFDEDDNDLITDDLQEPAIFREGAVLFIKDRASPSSSSFDISSAAFPDGSLYDVKDLEVSYDGTKLLFSMRAPEIENADEEDQPKWNIWEYDVPTASLRRLIESDTTAEEGHDLSPVYLPDGRILFSSTRQKTSKAILLDEDLGKPQFSALEEDRQVEAFTLHVMDEDGLNIEQITFNQSHDIDPIVRSDGKIIFTRWDNAGQTSNNGMNLYEVNPDGTGLQYLYGRHSHDSGDAGTTVQYAKPREGDNGNIVVQLREFVSESLGFLPVEIDVENYVEHDVEIGGLGINGQTPIISGLDTSGEPNLEGNYGALFPLYDGTNRYIASWSICRVQNILSDVEIGAGETPTIELCSTSNLAELDTTYEAAPPLYGLWIVDASDETKLPLELPEEGLQYDEAVIMTDRPLPTFIPTAVLDDESQALADNGFGILHIRSVYDLDGVFNAMGSGVADLDAMMDPDVTAPDNRPAWFLRLEKPASIPSDEVRDFDNSAFGRSAAQSMREILGYAPIEPDGSVKVAVPANVALAFSVLDSNGRRIQSTARHQNWLQVRPGETVECIGCHDGSSAVPHGRADAAPDAVNQGAMTTGVEFPNSVPSLSPDMGDTMAETYAIVNEVRRLTPDLHYIDEWTEASFTPATTLRYSYVDLETSIPTLGTCYENDDSNARDSYDDYDDWSVYCRAIINYEAHIHPLWAVNREVLDVDGMTVLEDRTCTSCHNDSAAMGGPMLPAGQLDLSDGQSADENREDFYKSYVELLFPDNEQELVTDAMMVSSLQDVDTTPPVMVPQFDANGDPIIDPDTGMQLVLEENPLDPRIVSQTMSTNGALASNAFLSKFEAGGSHVGYLSGAELRLISEWLDIGAQYFNNPFDAPAN